MITNQISDSQTRWDDILLKITDKEIGRRFETDGLINNDWYSWRKDIMAPFDGTIKKVNHPRSSNKPGVMDREAPTGYILFNHNNDLCTCQGN